MFRKTAVLACSAPYFLNGQCTAMPNIPRKKPEAVVERLLLYACPENGIVLDPFAGAGTTGLAARNLGRHAVLIELNPEYVEIAKRRLNLP